MVKTQQISRVLKEVRSLKREMKNSSLFRKRIYTMKEAALVSGVSLSFIQKLISSNQSKLKYVNSEPEFNGFTDKQKGWGIGILVFIILFVYVNYFSENTDETYITQSNNFASYSEENLDLAIRYSTDNDTHSFLNLTMNGQIFELDSDQEVHVLKAKFGKVKIRFKGSSEEVWVLSKAIKYK